MFVDRQTDREIHTYLSKICFLRDTKYISVNYEWLGFIKYEFFPIEYLETSAQLTSYIYCVSKCDEYCELLLYWVKLFCGLRIFMVNFIREEVNISLWTFNLRLDQQMKATHNIKTIKMSYWKMKWITFVRLVI